jgi:DNA-binding NarL/FixJ family response regulator
MEKIKVAIVDDHKILREGLKRILKDIPNVEVVIEASDGAEFIKQLDFITPHIAIVDINMPVMNGDEAVKLAKQKLPNLKVIILSMISSEDYYNTFNKLGVDGYLLKESDYEELNHAITSVMKGGKYFSQELLVNLLNHRNPEIHINITKREQEILQLLCSGFATQEISDKLHLSVRTVEKYRSDLLLKTGVSNSISLVLYAIKNKLVEIGK